jgi:hypothetical protein
MAFSALAALILLVSWIIWGRGVDIMLFVALTFLVANTVYLFFSRPTIRTSDLLKSASTSFALASLELQHQAQEVQAREAEAEQRRLADAEHNRYKLQVAKDLLQHLRPKVSLDRSEEAKLRQITYHAPREDTVTPPPAPPAPPAPSRPDPVRPTNGHAVGARPVPPTPSVSPAPTATPAG